MSTARVVTDSGPAYLKAPGNPEGPSHLASELVGTLLAQWFGLTTFPFALLTIDAEHDEIPLISGAIAKSGTAFVTKSTPGHSWGGTEEELNALVNPEDITRLIVFDTWIRNRDRHHPDIRVRRPNYDNVFLADAGGDRKDAFSRLIAMDHTHCFFDASQLNAKVARIDWVKDDQVYGLFPAFKSFVRDDEIRSSQKKLRELKREKIEAFVDKIPPDWEVNPPTRTALADFICQRATYVADTILPKLANECWPGKLFDSGN